MHLIIPTASQTVFSKYYLHTANLPTTWKLEMYGLYFLVFCNGCLLLLSHTYLVTLSSTWPVQHTAEVESGKMHRVERTSVDSTLQCRVPLTAQPAFLTTLHCTLQHCIGTHTFHHFALLFSFQYYFALPSLTTPPRTDVRCFVPIFLAANFYIFADLFGPALTINTNTFNFSSSPFRSSWPQLGKKPGHLLHWRCFHAILILQLLGLLE